MPHFPYASNLQNNTKRFSEPHPVAARVTYDLALVLCRLKAAQAAVGL
jgi:hypothetical protein